MEFDLLRHPQSPVDQPVESIRVRVDRQGEAGMGLHYSVQGDIGALVMPAMMATERADDLWTTTCFEAFLKGTDGGDRYVEYNFSPSSRWAAYVFDGYRGNGRDLAGASISRFDMRVGPDRMQMGVVVNRGGTADHAWRHATVALGLSAIIETRDGLKSYWALAHPPGSPDFHHGDCFAARLRAPGQE